MKLIFENLKDSSLNILRRAGYAFMRKDEKANEMSFVKRAGNADYPRLHIYVKALGYTGAEVNHHTCPGVVVNLHLDQKKASYAGATAHSGEYNSEESKWLEQEAENIKKEFQSGN